jgi:hypothetical protein
MNAVDLWGILLAIERDLIDIGVTMPPTLNIGRGNLRQAIISRYSLHHVLVVIGCGD